MRVSVVFNRRREAAAGSVEVQVYIDRKNRKYFATGVRVPVKQWDHAALCVRGHRNREALNLKINNLVNSINQWHRDCLLQNSTISISALNDYLSNSGTDFSLNDYLTKQLGNDKGTIRESTYKKREYALARFKVFGVFKPADFTADQVHAFHKWLLKQGMQPVSTRNYHKIIDTYLKRAEREGIIKKNPYADFKKPPIKRNIRFLTAGELQKLREYEGIERLEKVRDMFLFQCLTGMAYSDMQRLTWADVTLGERPYIIKPRLKADVMPQMTPLLPEAWAILQKYNNGHERCFPNISNQKMNAYLKEIATIKGVTKTTTTHVARHTFATLMLERGLPLETIAQILGHASTESTKIYARLLMSKINNDLDRLGIGGL